MSYAELHDDLRHLGPARALARAAYYRLQQLADFRLYRFVALSPGTVDPVLARTAPPLPCRRLDADELATLARDPENRLTPRLLSAHQRGDICVGFVDGDRLASQGWYTTRRTIVDPPVSVQFPDRYIYTYAVYTRPEYRGTRLHGLSFAWAVGDFNERGSEAIVGIAEEVNYAGRRSFRRIGFRDEGIVVRVGLGLRRIWQSAGCTRYGMAMRYDAEP